MDRPKKIMNDPRQVVPELLEGLVGACGHVDPDALSTFLILEAMAEYVGPT